MPEISEVAQTTDFLRQYIGKTLIRWLISPGYNCNLLHSESFCLFSNDLPLKLCGIERKGKFIFLTFYNEISRVHWYVLHSMMLTGRWQPTPEHYRLRWTLSFIGSTLIEDPGPSKTESTSYNLYFTDVRGFATAEFSTHASLVQEKISLLGPDAMTELTLEGLTNKARYHTKMNICNFLCNQNIIAGIGNILRAEILYHAGISPQRLISSLSDAELARLYQSIKQKINEFYLEGNFPYHIAATFRIYRNKNASKYRCSDRIIYWDPEVQK